MRKTFLLSMLLFIWSISVLNAQSNLIQNPSFELTTNLPAKISTNPYTGQYANRWNLSILNTVSSGDINVVTDASQHESKSMKVQLNAIDYRYRFYLSYDIPNLEPGVYEYSFYAKANIAELPFRIEAVAFNEVNKEHGTGTIQIPGVDLLKNGTAIGIEKKTSSDWVKYTFTIDASNMTADDLKIFRIYIRPNCKQNGSVENTTATYWFDNFSLCEVMEKKDIESITLSTTLQNGLQLSTNDTQYSLINPMLFTLSPKGASVTDVIYTVDKPEVLEIVDGVIKVKTAGTANIVLSSAKNSGIKSASFSVTVSVSDKFDLLMKTISQRYESGYSASRLNTNVASYLSSLKADGSFSDIDYTDASATNWDPINHLNRISEFIFAYTIPGNNYSASNDLYDKIVTSLQLWHTKHPKSSNWWNNQIAVPKSLGLSLIEMKHAPKQLPLTLVSDLISRMSADAGNLDQEEGANLIDVATDYFYRACLTKDEIALERSLAYAFQPLKLTGIKDSDVGIRYDYSFHQHGPQLYIGGYGDELIKGITDFALNTAGTEYELSGDKLDVMSKFVRNTYLKNLRGQYIHYNIMGRSVSRSGAMLKSSFSKYIDYMKTIDTTNASTYSDAVGRMNGSQAATYNIEPENILYPISDYVVHLRKNYSYSVRAVSERTAYVERGNGENTKAYYMTFGSTSMTTFGNEYRDIFPVWNWARIPGTTTPQHTTIPQRSEWGIKGKGQFVGGVSDSLYAVMTYNFDVTTSSKITKAKKSWFFFDDEIVCLGAGINSDESVAINTTVEQSLLTGDVTINNNSTESVLAKGDHSYTGGLKWVHHNRVGYFFPDGGNVSLTNKEQEGKWSDINSTQSTDAVKKDVFTLYLDHGTAPQNSTYSYIIAPNKLTAAAMSTHPISNIKIWKNTDKMQVVEHQALDMLQIVFFEAGKFENEQLTIEVDKACAIILKDVKTPSVTMHIADPAQSKASINVKTTFPSVSQDVITTVCDFTGSDDDHAGFSQMHKIEKGGSSGEIEVLYTIESPVSGDTFVHDGAANENVNHGTEADILIKKNPVGYNREGFIKLPLSGMSNLKDPTKEEVGKVELSLFTTYTNASADQVYWILNPVEDTTWDEKTITFVTKPVNSDEIIAQHKGHIRGAGVQDRIYFDITEYAKSELIKGKKEIAFRIYNNKEATDGKHDTKFGTKENSDSNKHPKVIVSVNPKQATIEHTVTVPALTGASFDYPTGEYNVADNANFAFALTLEADYSNSKPKVYVNGTELTAKTVNNRKYEYEILQVKGDVALTVDGLEKNDYSLKSLKINGVEHDIEQPYILGCDNDNTTLLTVELDVQDGVYVSVNKKFTVDVSKPVLQNIKIAIGSSASQIVEEHTLTIERLFRFSDLVINKFGSRLIVNNNPKTNGGYSFKDYTWYRNGEKVGTGQIYAPKQGTVGVTSDYSVEVTTKETPSRKLRTCSETITLKNSESISVYPNPVGAGQVITVKADIPENTNFESSRVEIYTLSGTLVTSTKLRGEYTQFNAPTIRAMYIMKINCGDIQKSFKLQVK